ncbi:MAG: peptidylprolyl isomerase [Gemmatimonadota bacterium]|nr:peptidylprolyl isomerase [Gemmatimonadota bacterium]
MPRTSEGETRVSAHGVPLVRVNGIDVSLNQVVRQLGVADKLDFFGEFARRELARQLAIREGIRTKPEDIQRDVDDWRYRHRLERVEDTESWLLSRGITLGDVAEDAQAKRLERALSDRVVDGRIEPYFAQHKLDFDEAEVCWIFHRDKGVIDEIGLQVGEEGADFCRLAREFSQDERTRPSGGFVGRVRRGQLPKGIAARLFAAAPGDVFGPEKASGGFALYMLQRNFPAILDDRVSNEIRDILFSRWLQGELQRADIHYPVWEAGGRDRP